MKKLIWSVLYAFVILAIPPCVHAQRVLIRHEPTVNSSRILIVYYDPEDYVQHIAQALHDKTDGDLFEIKLRHTYPDNHEKLLEQAALEYEEGFLPYLPFKLGSLERYDIIFIGTPVWNGHLPSAVSAFFRDYDLNDKKIIPFFSFDEDSDSTILSEITEQCLGCNLDAKGFITQRDDIFGLDKWLEEINFETLLEEAE